MSVKILAHSPTIRQRHTMPWRIVLAERPGAFSEYVVWTQTFQNQEGPEQQTFHGGHYFPIMRKTQAEVFAEAHKKFLEKCDELNRYIAAGNFTEIL